MGDGGISPHKEAPNRPDFVLGKKKYQAELIPPALLIRRWFADEQAAIESLEADIAALQQQLEEMAEEHGGEEGAFSECEKINRAEVSRRLKEVELEQAARPDRKTLKLADAPVPLRDGEPSEADILLTWLNLDARTTEVNRKLKAAQEALTGLVAARYPKLTEDEIKLLVVEDKWLATIAAAVQGELDRVSQTLTGRIRQLAERYATPLPELVSEVETLSVKVAGHLAKMGFKP